MYYYNELLHKLLRYVDKQQRGNQMRQASTVQPSKGFGSAAADGQACKRWERRNTIDRLAQITLEGQVASLPCRMVNQSSSGAMIEIDGAEAIAMRPTSGSGIVHLRMLHDRAEVACRMAWQQGARIGLRFIAPIRSLPKPAQRSTQTKKPSQRSVFGRWLPK